MLRHSAGPSGVHPYAPAGAPQTGTSGAWHLRDLCSFVPSYRSALHGSWVARLQSGFYAIPAGPLAATTASADFSLRPSFDARRPFRHKARSPRVRALAFTARSPDLRRLALAIGVSRCFARSPRSASPHIRFLFVDPRLRFPLPSRRAHAPTLCGSLWSRWPASRRTFTSKPMPMPGAQSEAPASGCWSGPLSNNRAQGLNCANMAPLQQPTGRMPALQLSGGGA